jgi:hypothetical protein
MDIRDGVSALCALSSMENFRQTLPDVRMKLIYIHIPFFAVESWQHRQGG